MDSNSDSSEEEELEEQPNEFDDFIINENEVEEEEDDDDESEERPAKEKENSNSGSDADEKSGEEDSDDDELMDEDLELIADNTGVDIQKKKKRKRIQRLDSDEDEQEDIVPPPTTLVDTQKRSRVESHRDDNLSDAENDEIEEGQVDVTRTDYHLPSQDASHESFDEEDDLRDFIADYEPEAGEERRHKKHKILHTDQNLQAAQDIFGVDVDWDPETGEMLEGDTDEVDHRASRTKPRSRLLDEEYEEEFEEEEEERQSEIIYDEDESVTDQKLALRSEGMAIFDPAELEKGYYTAKDSQIRVTDCPERYQLRVVPIKFIVSDSDSYQKDLLELREEAKWIYDEKWKLCRNVNPRFEDKLLPAIEEVLKMIRESQFELPFIATYRKEYIEISTNWFLTLPDLEEIYEMDAKWTQFMECRDKLLARIEKTVDFMNELRRERLLREDTDSSFKDFPEIPKFLLGMVNKAGNTKKLDDIAKLFRRDYEEYEGGANAFEELRREQPDLENCGELTEMAMSAAKAKPSLGRRPNPYSEGTRSGLKDFLQHFGLLPNEYCQNVSRMWRHKEVRRVPMLPLELASKYVNSRCVTEERVLSAARTMFAYSVSCDPDIRQTVRDEFSLKACVTCQPTPKGYVEIDETHSCYAYKYLTDKPVQSFLNDEELNLEQFLNIHYAAEDKLMTYEIAIPTHAYDDFMEKLHDLFRQDDCNMVAQLWNDQRTLIVNELVEVFLLPEIIRETKHKLIQQCQEALVQKCRIKLRNWLEVAPLSVSDEAAKDASTGRFYHRGYARVMALSYAAGTGRQSDESAYLVQLDPFGEVTDTLKVPALVQSRRPRSKRVTPQMEHDYDRIKKFIQRHRPHAIAIPTESLLALDIKVDFERMVEDLRSEQNIPPILVEFVDNDLSVIFQNSHKASLQFSKYPPILVQAVSLGRRLQNPLAEFCQAMNSDEDLLCLRMHPLQDRLPKELLLRNLEMEFVILTNKVGVDVSHCVNHQHYANMLQFICGLGPRKATKLLRTIKREMKTLINRVELVIKCSMGPCVVMNCAGFLRISQSTDFDNADEDAQCELLDTTRVHPESYELAKKMAVDALEWEDQPDNNQNEALAEIMEKPELVRELDLEAFAEELKRQDHGSKHITLNDIRKELTKPFEDVTRSYKSLNHVECFYLLTKENEHTLAVGSIVQAKFIRVARRKPQDPILDHASPERNELKKTWICPFCKNDNFEELTHVWQHFDNECPGQAIGINCIINNDIFAFLSERRIKDVMEANMCDRLDMNTIVQARVVKVVHEKFFIELSTCSSDLQDRRRLWTLQQDSYFDHAKSNEERVRFEQKAEAALARTENPAQIRISFHENFKNVSYAELLAKEPQLEIGEIVIRPSSKGKNRLTVHWKVEQGILACIEVIEKEKVNDYEIGKRLLIGEDSFDDLDEIVCNYVNPMVNFAAQILDYRHYRKRADFSACPSNKSDEEQIATFLRNNKMMAPSSIPYVIYALFDYPGYFSLSFLPGTSTVQREKIKVTPAGLAFRQCTFTSIEALVNSFKESVMRMLIKQQR